MELLTRTLLLCFALGLTTGAPAPPHDPLPDRCEGIEFDAITPDEKGNTFFFKGSHLWKGFRSQAQHSNEFFRDLNELHSSNHVDAAFRMHNPDVPGDHDHIYFFVNDKVMSFYNSTLEDGYPKLIQEDFPGIPSQLDAAVECPRGECRENSVLFFKGNQVYVYDILTKTVKTKTWSHLPVCTSVLRWLEHYYCFNGHNFTRFHPVTGDVTGFYPKDARHYFMSCPDFGHGGDRRPIKCSEVKIDAMTRDDTGKTYLFEGPNYSRLDTSRDGFHAYNITRSWREMTNGVDAAFSYTDKMYLIKDDQVYIYKTAAHYSLIEGYPKTLKEELGIDGHVDAAFLCPSEDTVHIVQGTVLRDVDLTATPRVVSREGPLPLSHIDAAMCGPEGVTLLKGSEYYRSESAALLVYSRIAPVPQSINSTMMGCQD